MYNNLTLEEELEFWQDEYNEALEMGVRAQRKISMIKRRIFRQFFITSLSRLTPLAGEGAISEHGESEGNSRPSPEANR